MPPRRASASPARRSPAVAHAPATSPADGTSGRIQELVDEVRSLEDTTDSLEDKVRSLEDKVSSLEPHGWFYDLPCYAAWMMLLGVPFREEIMNMYNMLTLIAGLVLMVATMVGIPMFSYGAAAAFFEVAGDFRTKPGECMLYLGLSLLFAVPVFFVLAGFWEWWSTPPTPPTTFWW